MNKPPGLLVHRSPVDRHESHFLLQEVRDQIGARVYPVHRLDKGTSGVVLFALHPEAAQRLGAAWQADGVEKSYLAVVRGYAAPRVVVDNPLRDLADAHSRRGAAGRERAAITEVECRAHIEFPSPVGPYATARYSLVACRPRTGRRHQLRRHLKHLRHPVIGDANYGDGAHNRFFRDSLGIARLLLAATRVRLPHPCGAAEVVIEAPLDGDFAALLARPEWRAVPGDADGAVADIR